MVALGFFLFFHAVTFYQYFWSVARFLRDSCECYYLKQFHCRYFKSLCVNISSHSPWPVDNLHTTSLISLSRAPLHRHNNSCRCMVCYSKRNPGYPIYARVTQYPRRSQAGLISSWCRTFQTHPAFSRRSQTQYSDLDVVQRSRSISGCKCHSLKCANEKQ